MRSVEYAAFLLFSIFAVAPGFGGGNPEGKAVAAARSIFTPGAISTIGGYQDKYFANEVQMTWGNAPSQQRISKWDGISYFSGTFTREQYNLYDNSAYIASTTANAYAVHSLAEGSHVLSVRTVIKYFSFGFPGWTTTLSNSTTISVIIDLTPPTAPSSIELEPPLHIQEDPERFFTRQEWPILHWGASSDKPDSLLGSGIGGYRIYQDGILITEVINPNVMLSQGGAALPEGVSSYRISAVDNVGNESPPATDDSDELIFVVDRTPPAKVALNENSIRFEIRDAKLAVFISWNAVEDLPAENACGVKRYILQRRARGEELWTSFEIGAQAGVPAYTADFADPGTFSPFKGDMEYELRIVSVDQLGNSNEDDLSGSDAIRFVTPPAAMRFDSIASAGTVEEGTPTYRNRLVLDSLPAGLRHPAIDHYHLERAALDPGIPEQSFTFTAAQALSDLTAAQEHWSVDKSSGRIVFTDTLSGAGSAHRRLQYRLVTVYGAGAAEAAVLSPELRLANITPVFWVRLKNAVGDTLAEVDPQGLDAASGAPVRVTANGPVMLDLTLESGSDRDAEGDSLRYQLWTVNGSLLGESWTETSPIELSRSQSLTYPLYVLVEEFASLDGSPPKSLGDSALYGEGYQPQKTVHDRPPEGFFVSFDFGAPLGAFKIVRRDGGAAEELSATRPTPVPEVDLLIPAGALTDAVHGGVDSGIDHLKIWNLNVEDLVDVEHVVPEDIEARLDSAYLTVPIGSEPGEAAPATDRSIRWTLSSGSDGYRVVVMKVLDRAGNEYLFWRVVLLDATIPAAPDIGTFAHTHQGSSILLEWGIPPDDRHLRYRLTYPPSPGSPPDQKETGGNSYLIPVGGYGPNQEVRITLQAFDPAGNLSPVVSYSLYTRASLGTLSEPVQDYGEDGHSLRWSLQGGAAASHVLEALNTGPDGRPDGTVHHALPLLAGAFRDTHLPAHGKLYYRLVAYNSFVPQGGGQGDRTAGMIFAHTLANHAPSAPSGLSPSGLAGAALAFRWSPSTDLDGDQIRYHLYYCLEGSQTYRLLGTTTSEQFTPPALSFQSGRMYRWYVEADDTPASGYYAGLRSQSAVASFTYDSAGPVIQLMDFPQTPFTNQEALGVRVSDDQNGTPTLVYWTSNGTVPPENPQPVALQQIESRLFEGSLPLPEEAAPYTVSFRARDLAGNLGQLTSPVLRVDRTPPSLLAVELELPQEGGVSLCADGRVPAQLQVIDNFSGVSSYEYAFAGNQTDPISAWEENPAEVSVQLDGSFGQKTHYRVHKLSGADGQTYYLAVRLRDCAGNSSEIFYAPSPVFLDASAPQAELTVGGWPASGGGYFVSDIDSLLVGFTCSDPHSAVTGRYALTTADAAEPPAWYGSWEAAKSAGTLSGERYRILAEAQNRTGLRSRRASAVFIFDNSGPSIQSASVSPAGPFVPTELLRLAVKAQDPESQIREYRVAAGMVSGGRELTSTVPGNRDGWLVKPGPAEALDFSLILPEVANGTYPVTVAVQNNAGLVNYYHAVQPIVVDGSLGRVVVWDNGPYSAEGLRSFWRYTGPEAVAGFLYRVASEANPEPAWISTTRAQAAVEAEALVEGRRHWVEVQAVLESGAATAVGRSLGVVPDHTLPYFAQTDGLATPAACTSRSLSVSWNAGDAGSGLQRVEVLLESLENDGSTLELSSGWMTVSAALTGATVTLNADANGAPLALHTGQRVYLTLRITDAAGLSAEKASGLIVIDDTPPPAPFVIDQGEVVNTAQSLEAHWSWTPSDPESGTSEYLWAAYKLGQSLEQAAWKPVQEQTRASAPAGQHRETWFFAVKAINRAGLESIGVSNGILCDETAPFVSRVKVIGGGMEDPGGAEETTYAHSAEGLQLYIDTFDNESPVMMYRARSGTWNSLAEWSPDTGLAALEGPGNILNLPAEQFSPEGITVFRGECINAAALVSEYGYSQGVLIDAGRPAIESIRASLTGEDIDFDWRVTGSRPPIEQYFVAFVADGMVPALEEYLAIGTQPRYRLNTREAGIGEGRYRLYVGARNAAGLYTETPGVSEVLILDNSPPQISAFETPVYASRLLTLRADAQDEFSGISEYDYAIGSAADPQAHCGGWLSRRSRAVTLSTAIDLDGLFAPVPHGATIFVRLRVRNGAGLWSAQRVSDPILVDRTPASRPHVQCPAKTPYEHRVKDISISSSDPESGMTHYRIQVTTDTSLANLEAAEIFPLTEPNPSGLSLENLSLEDTGTYYLAVQIKNGARDWSEVGYSNPFTVDSTPPQLHFQNGAQTMIVNALPVIVGYTVSEDVTVTFRLVYPSGGSTVLDPVPAAEGWKTFLFAETATGIYKLHAELVDSAGNVGNTGPEASLQRLRVNAAPEVTLLEAATTPGYPLPLSAAVYDPDGDAPFSYLWEFGDESAASTELAPVHAFFHDVPSAQRSEYTVKVTVTDSAGKASSRSAAVTVLNTSEGRLYADEYWSGVQVLRGSVLIPIGLRLRTAPGTRVQVSGDPVGGYDHRLTVEGILEPGAGTRFALEEGVNATWNGILVRGQAHFEGVEVQQAERGITITAAAVASVRDCRLERNRIGLHILGNALSVERSRFAENSLYAVKEDAGAAPSIRDCVFTGNLYDYYDEQLTVIDPGRLNQMPGNSGNVRE